MFERKIMIAGEMVTVISHKGMRMHLDEIAAEWLVQKFAGPDFINKHCPDKVLPLGVLGSGFDEHPKSAGERRLKGECAASLMAKALGKSDDPRLKVILDFVLGDDGSGRYKQRGNFPIAINELHDFLPDDPEKVIAWVKKGLGAKYNQPIQNKDFTVAEIYKVLKAVNYETPLIHRNLVYLKRHRKVSF